MRLGPQVEAVLSVIRFGPRVRCPWCANVVRTIRPARDEYGLLKLCKHRAPTAVWRVCEGSRKLVKPTTVKRWYGRVAREASDLFEQALYAELWT